jgi:hypothetical protein
MTTLPELQQRTAIMQALQQIVNDGDPIRTMLLLTDLADLGMKHGLVDETHRANLAQLHLLLAEIALSKQKERD